MRPEPWTNQLSMFHAPGKPARTQAQKAILRLLRYKQATSKELMDYSGSLNYRARISELRKLGAVIECRKHPSIPGVNIYRLAKDLPDDPNEDGAPLE